MKGMAFVIISYQEKNISVPFNSNTGRDKWTKVGHFTEVFMKGLT